MQNHSVDQHALFTSLPFLESKKYWLHQLQGLANQESSLLFQGERSLNPFGKFRFQLDQATATQLLTLGKQNELSVYIYILSAYSLVVHAYTGAASVRVASPLFNEKLNNFPETYNAFLPLLCRVNGEHTFREHLSAVQGVVLQAAKNQHYPLEKVYETLAIKSLSTFFDTSFRCATLHREAYSCPFSIELEVVAGDIFLTFESTVATPFSLEQLFTHLERMLAFSLANINIPVREMKLILPSAEQALLLGWSNASNFNQAFNASQPLDAGEVYSLRQALWSQLSEGGDQVAIRGRDSQLSYAQLQQQSSRLADALQKRGLLPGDHVAVLLERSPELIVALLALWQNGLVYVPIDPTYPPERIAFMLTDAQPALVLTQSDYQPLTEGYATGLLTDLLAEPLSSGSVVWPPVDAVPGASRAAYLIYTSGSTGQPKGVLVSEANLDGFAQHLSRHYLDQGPVTMPWLASASFDISLFQLLLPLLSGGTILLADAQHLGDLDGLAQLLEQATALDTVPALYQGLVSHLSGQAARFERLRQVFIGGDAIPDALLGQLSEVFSSARIVVTYGPTEGTIFCAHRVYEAGALPVGVKGAVMGRPISTAELYVLDAQHQLLPVGVEGELCIGGAGVSQGYWQRPELTGEKFIAHPFRQDPTARLYRTGDWARWTREGELEFRGRRDSQVKIRGFRIELGEIEAALLSLPGVQQAVVVARTEGAGKQLVAYVVPGATTPGEDSAAILEELRTRLPEQLVPARLVVLEQLPLTPHGKIDRAALPDPARLVADTPHYLAPQTPQQTLLAGIWQELLGVERVGLSDNFFELGGDSIIAIQVVSRARRAGLHVQAKEVFLHPTLGKLSVVLAGREGAQELVGEQGRLLGESGLLPVQQHLLSSGRPEAHHFNQSVLLGIDKCIPTAQLEQVVAVLVAQHDALRFAYQRTESGWQQRYAEADIALIVEPLTDTQKQSLAQLIEERANAYQRSLNLEKGELCRVVLFQTPDTETHHRLLFIVHHLAVDGVSWRILLEELSQLLEQARSHQPLSLGAKSSSYRQWQAALAAYGQSERALSQLAYWQGVVKAAKPLPLDAVDGSAAAGAGHWEGRLPAELTQALLQGVPAVYHTEVNDLLLSALAQTLGEWSGQRPVVIGLEGHGREPDLVEGVDLSRTVGWFTSLYPVRLPTASQPGELIAAVKETLRQVPDKGMGYGVLRELNGETSLRGAAPWEVVFNYLGQFDQVMSRRSSWLVPAEESAGDNQPAGYQSEEKLSVTVRVQGGELIVGWGYASAQLSPATVQALGEAFLAQLRELIDHCQRQPASVKTPSDYGLSPEVSYPELEAFLAQESEGEPLGRRLSSLYRLSGLQEGMLFHSLYDSASTAYVEQFTYELRKVELAVFTRSWQALLARHSMLRTGFFAEAFSLPVQAVYHQASMPITVLDYRHLPVEQQQRTLSELEAADRARGFDLQHPPLMRVSLIRLEQARYRMIWTHHHLILDGWSLPVLMEEFLQTYEALLAGQALAVGGEDRYEDYIRHLERRDPWRERAYWQGYLGGLETATLLPFIGATAQRNAGLGTYGEVSFSLDESATGRLEGFAQRQGVTLNTVMQGVWAYLLAHYTGQARVTFGVTVSGRPPELADVERRIGLYINTIPLHTVVREEQPLREWLLALQGEQLQSREFEHSSLSQIQQWIGIPGDLFDSVLVFENYPVSQVLGARQWSLEVVEARQRQEQTNYPLSLIVSAAKTIHVVMGYNADLLEETYVSRMGDHFQHVLEQLAEPGVKKMADLDLLTPHEQRALLERYAGSVDYPRNQTLVDLLEAQVLRTPKELALLFDKHRVTYEELHERANQVAHYLRSKGVKEDTLVPICLERGMAMVVGILGILKAGAAYVPIDPEYPLERITYMLEDTQAAVIVSSFACRALFPPEQQSAIIELDGDASVISRQSTQPPRIQTSPDSLAYIIYTSGSTGRPKGVEITHRNAVAFLSWCQTEFETSTFDIVFASTSYCFDLSIFEIFYPFSIGKPIRVLRSGLDIHTYLTSDERILINTVPSVVDHLLKEGADFSRVTVLNMAGEPIPYATKQALDYGRMQVRNLYGPSEDTTYSSCYRFSDEHTIIPIGKPISNSQFLMLDAQLRLVPDGVVGEIYVAGEGLARGYLHRPELTAEKFIPHPFVPGERLYRTGDLGRWLPDGNAEYLGRVDDQVKIRGYRIELGEIETVLRQSEGVQQAVVVARTNEEGQPQLVAYVVAEPPFDRQAELTYLRSRLPEYMVPTLLVELEALPLTPNGKINKKALPHPEAKAILTRAYLAPRNETEKTVARCWQSVLNVAQVSADAHFFELGGHSLLATRAVSALRRELRVELAIKDLFTHPTVEALARHLQGLQPGLRLPALTPGQRPEYLPLSFSQERLWFMDQLEGSLQYHLPAVLRLAGKLNIEALTKALQTIVNRHEVLRTVIEQRNGKPYQRVLPPDGWNLITLEAMDEEGDVWQERVGSLISQPFDLAHESSLRAHLLPLGTHQHLLVLTMHHIASDGWSLPIFVGELVDLYRSFTTNRPISLSPLPVQYADYALWQRAYLQGEVLEQQLAYWQQQLAGVSPLQLPTDYPRPPLPSIRGAVVQCTLDSSLTHALRDVSQAQGTTLFMTLLAAFKVLLYRYSGQSDLLVGTPIANRQPQEVEGLIGFFVNTLVLRSQVGSEMPFEQLLQAIKQTTLEAYEHQQVPFERVVEQLGLERDRSRSPLFDVKFALHNVPDVGKVDLGPEVEVTVEGRGPVRSQLDISVDVVESMDGLHVGLTYCLDLYREATMRRMLGHFRQILIALVANPTQSIGTLPLLTESEQNQLRVQFNQTAVGYPTDTTVVALFERQAAQTPDAVALRYAHQTLTYGELDARANQLAHYLKGKGVKEETLVPICLPRSLEMLMGILGILKAGGAYVPLDADYPADRLAYMLEDTAARVVVATSATAAKLSLSATTFLVELDREEPLLRKLSTRPPVTSLAAHHLAYVIYTSGSTGRPKGVLIEHRGLVNVCLDHIEEFGMNGQDVYLQFMSPSFDGAILDMFSTLLSGATLVLPDQEILGSSQQFIAFLERHRVSILTVTPSFLAILQKAALPTVRTLVSAGEAAIPEDAWYYGHRKNFYNGYGPSEVTINATLFKVAPGDQERYSAVPIGKPRANKRIYILNEQAELCPLHIAGEICIGGTGLARGYWNRTELTAEKFIPDPFVPGARLYRTGDLGRWLPDGNLDYLGRIDDQVKIRGYRIELSEIEHAFMQQPSVRQAVVLARADGEGHKLLVAYLVADETFEKEAVLAELGKTLPDYMVPALLVELERLPLTPNGKVDKKALPDPEAVNSSNRYVAPRIGVESQLAAIWQELLETEPIGVEDNFFELGGHSLLAIRLISAIRKELTIEVPIGDVFDYPTIRGLADHLARPATSATPALPDLRAQPRPARIPLSFSQERLWFIDQLEGSLQYHIPAVLRLAGKLNIEALTKAFQGIINRHEVLRTVIVPEGGQPYQQIREPNQWQLTYVGNSPYQHDLSALRDWVETLIHQPFDLSKDAMLRVHVVHLPEDQHWLILTMHHIASDGWSLPIIVRELVAFYQAYDTQSAPQVIPLAIQYADYALWQRNYLQGEVLAQKLAYWQAKLADVEALQLPTDFPRPVVWSAQGAAQSFAIGRAASVALLQLSQQQGCTLFMTLLTSFKVLLYRYSGQTNLCVGTPIANRTRQEVEELIGFFVNTLVLRSDLSENPSFTSLLERVRQTTLEAYEHQDVPFEKVVETLVKERNIGQNPLFQVMFVLQNTPDTPRLELGEAVLSEEVFAHTTARFDLTFTMVETVEGLVGSVEYATDLFLPATIERMVEHFRHLLQAIVANPHQAISQLDFLPADERRLLLEDFQGKLVASDPTQTVLSRFAHQVARTPDSVALVFEGQHLSFAQLDEAANRLALLLQREGVGAETLVPLLLEPGLEQTIAVLGVWKAGGAYVPIDPATPASRLHFLLQDTQANLLLTTSQSRPSQPLPNALTILELDRMDLLTGLEQSDDDSSILTPLPVVKPEQLAYVLYTSGSTGEPKGVMIQHDSLCHYLTNAQTHYLTPVGESGRFESDHPATPLNDETGSARIGAGSYQLLSYGFDASLTSSWLPLLAGQPLVLAPSSGSALFEAAALAQNAPYGFLKLTPAHLPLLALAKGAPFTSRLVVGGEALLSSQLQALADLGQELEIINEYGPTETTVGITTYRFSLSQLNSLPSRLPIGKPLDNTQLYLLDSQGQLVPLGVVGEICLAGVSLARGYWNRPELTAEKFIPHPFSEEPTARLYRTGDLGRWLPDGTLLYEGRLDEQVKIRGYRIEPGEIEAVLVQSGLVEQAVVVSQASGENKQLQGYYVPSPEIIRSKERLLTQKRVASWNELYENQYGKVEQQPEGDPEFDIIGWGDSFTGGAIPAEHMREWLDDITKVIVDQQPQRVLEIGCGTGLIYYQLAPHVRRYLGTDFSEATVQRLRQRAATTPYAAKADFQTCAAHEVMLAAGEEVDTIVLNSIIQYFPSEAYLSEVLARSLTMLRGHGRIIIGDVRDSRLLKFFKARLVLPKLPENSSLKEFWFNLEQEVAKEEELCVDPGYFYALQNQYPEIAHVDIQWKRGDARNELTLYRYTVILHLGAPQAVHQPQWQTWQSLDYENVVRQLTQETATLALSGVPNPRLWQDRRLHTAPEEKSLSQVRSLSEYISQRDEESVAVEQLLALATEQGYQTRFLLDDNPFQVNLMLEKEPFQGFILSRNEAIKPTQPAVSSNRPLLQDICLSLQKDLHSALLAHLPEYMVPSSWVALTKLPFTTNGKVDRAFLSTREEVQRRASETYQAPATEMERSLTAIWEELLGMQGIGTEENFFELGGHSLLATRVASSIRKQLNVELAIRDLFLYPTITTLATYVGGKRKGIQMPAITLAERPDAIPLSFGQERLWVVDQLEGSVPYHIPAVLRLNGSLQTEALAAAFQNIVRRHEVLRTVIRQRDGQPLQTIRSAEDWQLVVLPEVADQANTEVLQAKIASLIAQPFNLASDYLFRAYLIRLAPQESVLVVIMHHLVSDGWSMPLLVRELTEFYRAFVENRPAQLPALPIQYADYAIWQRQYLSGTMLTRQVAYWQQKLSGIEPLQLPTDYPRPELQSSQGALFPFSLDKQLSEQLRQLSQEQGVTVFMTLLAAFKVLMHRYSGQTDICVGTPIANRQQPEVEGLIGFFINMLALRSDLSENPAFTDLLQQVKQTTLDAYEYQQVPFEKVVEAVMTQRDVSRSPLFQVMFVLQNNAPVEQVESLFADVRLSQQAIGHTSAKFDLTFTMAETHQGLVGSVEYCTDLYQQQTIVQWVAHFEQLLKSLVKHPEHQLSQLTILPSAEQATLLDWSNASEASIAINPNAHSYSLRQALWTQLSEGGDQVAIRGRDSQLSYAQLQQQSSRLADALQKRGLLPGDHVAVLLERSPELIVALLALWQNGLVYVPIDPTYPPERIAFMLSDAQPALVLTQSAYQPLTESYPSQLLTDLLAQPLSEAPVIWPPVDAVPSGAAYLIYTSGSTGQPKGVLVSEANLDAFGQHLSRHYLDQGPVAMPWLASASFDISLFQLLLPLLSGGTILLADAQHLADLEELARLLEGATALDTVPALYQGLVQHLAGQSARFERLRQVFIGGDAIPDALLGQLSEVFSSARIVVTYGPTEGTIFCAHRVYEAGALPVGVKGAVMGRPISTAELYVLDAQQQLLPVGVEGELCIGGAGVSQGYWQRPELTGEKFIPHPFSSDASARLYRTGDWARWTREGELEFRGRRDSQVKIRGFRIELGEIEAALLALPGVQQAVVVARTEGAGKQLVAYVVPGATTPGEDSAAILEELRTRLPEQLVPARLVVLEQLPLTPHGKIDRAALPDPARLVADAPHYLAPQTPQQTLLAGIWQELLGVAQVGLSDNFFELGGDSIIAIQVVSRARRSGLELQAKEVFLHPTLGKLSAVLAGRAQAQQLVGEQGRLSGESGLLPVQQHLLSSAPPPQHFNQSVLLGIDKTIPTAQLQQVVAVLVAQHDALRFAYQPTESGWQQSYGEADIQLVVEPLTDTQKQSLAQLIEERANAYQRSLNLEKGELCRIVLLETPAIETHHRLLFIVHHLAVDGVSWRILLEELSQLLEQVRTGAALSLGAKSSSYRQWQAALQAYGQSPRALSQLPYWQGVVKAAKPLPVDEVAEATPNGAGHWEGRLPATLTQALLQQVPAVYHTEVNDLLLAALAQTLGEWSGQSPVVIGLEGHGREPDLVEGVDLSRTLGWFTSLYPVRLPTASQPGELIASVKETLRQVPDKGMAYGVLKYLNGEASLQGPAPWDVVFNYLGQFDQVMSRRSSWLVPAEESAGDNQPAGYQSEEKLSVTARVQGGELIVGWGYASAQLSPATVQALGEAFLAHLSELIDHCQRQPASVKTPSDYGLSPEVSYPELEAFLVQESEGKPLGRRLSSLYRLSGLQEGMLFHSLYDSASTAYVEQFTYELRKVELAVFTRSWQALLARHSMLRTGFFAEAFSLPVQAVFHRATMPITTLDYRHLPAEQQQRALSELEAADRARGFELSRPPLMRVSLIRLEQARYRMIWTHHHLILDGWSLPVLMEEFLRTYEALLAGQALAVGGEDRYEDYIRHLAGRDPWRERAYWQGYLGGLETATLLPFIGATAQRNAGLGRYGEVSFSLDESATSRLEGFAQRQGVTLNTVMQGVWAYLLAHYTGQARVTFGVTVSGRPPELADVERRIGLYINTLPLCAQYDSSATFGEWLLALQGEQLQSREFEHSSLSQLQQWIGIPGDLFDSVLVFENYPVSQVIASRPWQLEVELVGMREQTNYPLSIIIGAAQRIHVAMEYNASLLAPEDVQRISAHFQYVLEQLVEKENPRLNELRILRHQEQVHLLEGFNRTTVAYPLEKTLVTLFTEQVTKSPDAVAIVFGEQTLSYQQLDAKTNQLAHYLRSQGVVEEMLVPICLERSLEMLIGIVGILKAGGAYVPIDPTYPTERISYMLTDTGASLVLAHSSSAASLVHTATTRVIDLDTDWPLIHQQPSHALESRVEAHHLAYVLYTSGSTGRPKGVMIEHQGVVNRLLWAQDYFQLTASDTVLQKTTFCFDVSVWELLWPVLVGARLVMAKPEGQKDSAYVREIIDAQVVTVLHFVPSMLEVFLLDTPSGACPQLRQVLCSGEALKASQVALFKEKLPHVTLYNLYGPTEAAIDVTCWRVPSGEEPIHTVSIGKPVANTRLFVLNPERSLVPIGCTGELHIGGVQLARGYLNQPGLTAEKFIPHPFVPGERLYKTGDWVRWLPDGNLEYLGRIDDQVKIRGFRIELGEIEAVLMQSKLVRQVVVLVKQLADNQRLVAYVVPADPFGKESLLAFAKEHLPEYMVPSVLVEVDQLPLTPNGKVDKKALPEPDAASGTAYVAPRNDEEAALVQIWQTLFGDATIGVTDNFFELGGHSLLATRASSAIGRRMGVQLPIRVLYEHPTIADLANYLELERSAGPASEPSDEFETLIL